MKAAERAIRVMLIDDHQTMLWGLEKLIQGEAPRMEVVGIARNCEEALSEIGKSIPDVILLDLDLGGRSGLDLLPSLLSNSVSRVLILTGAREQAMLDSAVLGGAHGVLRKDASAEQLLKAIEKVHSGELWLDHQMLGRVFREFTNPTATRKLVPEMKKKAALTVRELRIIQALVEQIGASNKEIAKQLFISEHTLRNHLTAIYQKLNVGNRLELYAYATKHIFAGASAELQITSKSREHLCPMTERLVG